jgi:hypothetical protein
MCNLGPRRPLLRRRQARRRGSGTTFSRPSRASAMTFTSKSATARLVSRARLPPSLRCCLRLTLGAGAATLATRLPSAPVSAAANLRELAEAGLPARSARRALRAPGRIPHTFLPLFWFCAPAVCADAERGAERIRERGFPRHFFQRLLGLGQDRQLQDSPQGRVLPTWNRTILPVCSYAALRRHPCFPSGPVSLRLCTTVDERRLQVSGQCRRIFHQS